MRQESPAGPGGPDRIGDMPVRRKSVGRPARTSLSALLDAAVELGLDRFTLSAVAKRTGIAEATVYNYVSGRDELYRLACDRLFAGVTLETDPAVDSGSWTDYIDNVSEQAVTLAAAHPGLTEYLFYGPLGPETVRIYRTIVDETMRRCPVLDANTAYFVASRSFLAALTLASHPRYHGAGRWLRQALTAGIDTRIAAGDLPELPGDWTDVLEELR